MPAFPQSGPELDRYINLLMSTQPQAFFDYDITRRNLLSDAMQRSTERGSGRQSYSISGYWENGEWKGFQGEYSVAEGSGRFSQEGVVTFFPPTPTTPTQQTPSGGVPTSPTVVPSAAVSTTAMTPATPPTAQETRMPVSPPSGRTPPLRPVVVPRTMQQEPVEEEGINPVLLIGGAVLVFLYFSSRK